ncbi:TlpA family protein disulfide reductase [Flavobacterium sp. F-65]|uniref:TlpA family protein disulfide reductase n=1 Tax=Flavobacterium pisciphilum TaxID=2893755 RepID=A0ABS8MRR0_9FLAO|nr:TlpA disulfide reductase family protein [Flavobacterium sp. F-65]MCC9070832.1 TlpA family protein disulfide reductase [Flavobacterium sp. F-65]
MNKLHSLIVLFLIFTSSFGQAKYGNPEVDPIKIQKTYSDWWAYQSKNIMLSRDFVALDSLSREISKETFLDELANGSYIPIRLKSEDTVCYYKLFKIALNSDTSIKATINQEAFDGYKNFKMENTIFPKFSFKDLNGTLVTNESMKGKIVVIKCWYIHCAACIKEFPDVNQLVEKYKNREDIIFVSLAEDTPEQLNAFLKRKPLSYSVIPNMKIYMNETLQLNAFPTHFIINKEGIIAKVLNNYESLELALAKESKL